MKPEISSPDPEEILSNQGFMQRLARGIVGEEHSADDLVQQAWLAALEHPRRAPGSLRAWLARVVRNAAINQARSESRRSDREQRAAQAEALPPSDHMELQLELQRRVLEAVQRLEEPYKTAIFLRYYEDLAPARIAQRLVLPEPTVKTHLRRGLASLRTALDKEFGGDRRTWSLALIPIAAKGAMHAARGGSILGAATKGAWMGAKAKLTVAIIVVTGLSLLFWNPWNSADDRSAAPSTSGLANAATPLFSSNIETLALTAAEPSAGETRATIPAIEKPSTPKDGDVLIRGRVVDARRFPVAGADVSLHLSGGRADHAKSDARGEFQLIAGARPKDRSLLGGVHAMDGQTAAVQSCVVSSESEQDRVLRTGVSRPQASIVELRPLVLEPAYSIRARVLDNGVPVAGARVIAQWDSRRIPAAEARSDEQGLVELDGLPMGKVMLHALTPGKVGRAWMFVPGAHAQSVDVELQGTRSIDVFVVDSATKEGVPGVVLTVMESLRVDTRLGADSPEYRMADTNRQQSMDLAIEPTDAHGHSRMTDVPAIGGLSVSCVAPGFRKTDLLATKSVRLSSETTSVRIELEKGATHNVRWRLEPGEVGIPPDGSTVRLFRARLPSFAEDSPPPPETGRIENGELVVDGFPSDLHEALGVAQDGSIAALRVSNDDAIGNQGKPVSFRKEHKIDVVVRDDRGQPVEGARALACNQGNNQLIEAVATAADGGAVLRGMAPQLVQVRVMAPGEAGQGELAGSVDLAKGDGSIEFTLARTVELCIRVLVRGRAQLPGKFNLSQEPGGRYAKLIREDPEKGLLFFSIVVPAGVHEIGLSLLASGHAPAATSVNFDRDAEQRIIDFELIPAATVVARVDRTSGQEVDLILETWDQDKGQWITPPIQRFRGMKSPNGPEGTFRIDDCPPGRHRVRERKTNVVSTEAEVTSDARDVEVSLELARVQSVSGVVEFPIGTDASQVRVVVDGDGSTVEEPGVWRTSDIYVGAHVDAVGRFKLEIPLDHAARVRAWHPFLVPAKDGGSVEVKAARDDVRLRLVEGAEVRIPLPQSVLDLKPQCLRVLQYAHEPSGKPQAWFHAPIVEGVARFSGIAPGTWTLWIDTLSTFAPILLRDVAIGEGITSFAEPKLTLGSSIRVRVLVKAGQSVPRVYVAAKSQGEPGYSRDINSRGEEVVILSGLSRGTFELHMMPVMDGKPPPARSVQLDGSTDLEVELDLR